MPAAPPFARLDVAPLVADLAELYTAVAEERGTTLTLAAPSPLLVNGDRALIQQAVANLLDNAIKFSPSGGIIHLTAALQGDVGDDYRERPGSRYSRGRPGRATERFFRGEAARQTPGSGLGLALVDAVAQLHGGSLQLEDAGPGLRAVLTLPCMPP